MAWWKPRRSGSAPDPSSSTSGPSEQSEQPGSGLWLPPQRPRPAPAPPPTPARESRAESEPSEPPRTPSDGRRWVRVQRLQIWLRQHLLVALLLAGLLGGAVCGLATRYGPLQPPADSQTQATNRILGSDFPGGASVRVPLIVPKLTPSVVEIHARSLTGTSVGSGIVLSANGLILTNFHVISPASPAGSLAVRLARGQPTRQATLVGADPSADLAVLQVRQTGGLTPAPLGNSSRTRVGESIIAMGSPEGLQGSVSYGIVSALNRTIRVAGARSGLAGTGPPVTYRAIQTDAAVNPGSSGGALINMRGEVIGMTSSVYHPVAGGASVGLNFAIPINDAQALVTRMLTAHS